MSSMKYEETELRLGLPGGGGGGEAAAKSCGGKRGFDLTMDLKLSKEAMLEEMQKLKEAKSFSSSSSAAPRPATPPTDPAKPPTKTQVVGWPPVRSFRKNILTPAQTSHSDDSDKTSTIAAYVKVSMDGAPYLRKVDLKTYKSYQELSDALGKMFSSFTIGNCGSQGMKDFMNESKLIDLLNGSEYVPSYEDKDGDWMLVGDVPWEMFVASCKRLRIMKGSEAIGLAPRAVEKCKNRC